MNIMMGIKVIIFDFDGVIVDSNHIKGKAFQELFSDYNKEFIKKILVYHKRNKGISRYKKFVHYYKLLGLDINDKEIKRLDKVFSKLVYKKVVKAKYTPGVIQFLRSVYKIVPLYVVSATPESEIRKIVKIRGLNKFFRRVYGAPSEKADIINKIIKNNKVSSREVLYIGDSRNDYEVAIKTGVKFFALAYNDKLPRELEYKKLFAKDFSNINLNKLLSIYE